MTFFAVVLILLIAIFWLWHDEKLIDSDVWQGPVLEVPINSVPMSKSLTPLTQKPRGRGVVCWTANDKHSARPLCSMMEMSNEEIW